MAKRFDEDVAALCDAYGMDRAAVREFLGNALSVGFLPTTGSDVQAVLPPMSKFGGASALDAHDRKRAAIMGELERLFEAYRGIHEVE